MKKYLLLFILLLVACVYGYFIGIKNIQTHVAVGDGETYTAKMYSDYTVIGKSCQGEDTDGDSYVSCDFRLKNASSEKILHLQCPTTIKSLTGSICKEYRLTIPQ